MKKLLAYPLTLIYYFIFGALLGIFHIIQVIAYNLFGYSAHKKTVDALNYLLVKNLYTLFCRPSFHGVDNLPENTPLIIVSNHQSMFDISPVVWGFHKHHVKFISKKELGKGIPSISYNLKKGGSALIDRKSGSQAIKEILKLGRNMEQKKWSACIFPEGTRSKNGKLKKFQLAGFKTLLKASPSALIVPFVINGNYRLLKWGSFPLNIGLRLKYTALQSIDRKDFNSEGELLEYVKKQIEENLE